MPTMAIIGGQWGDEGKGKIVDLMAEKAKVVARFSGGSNAGHTVIHKGQEFGLHLIPSGIFYPQVTCVIGNGVVIDPALLLKEIDLLNQRGVSTANLVISDRAHLVMPYHILLDGLEEEARGGSAIGTTRKGIGPVFADKVARLGIRAGDLLENDAFYSRLQTVLPHKNKILTLIYGVPPLSTEDICSQYLAYGERLAPYIRDTESIVQEALARGEWVLLEGAQGTMLDPEFGTYPYVTSGTPTVAGACTGLGISPTQITSILGIYKVYTTRVGSGPLPTELCDETGDQIRELAHEFGTTTGRPRRCGWFDGVVGRYSARVNGFTTVALTRLDILDSLPKIKVCIGYEVEGKFLQYPPANAATLEKCKPIYEDMAGWQKPTSHLRHFQDLPAEAQAYVNRLEKIISSPIALISVGPSREQVIVIKPLI
ncbi:MAG: adenylosuccinate synthase [Chloroflexi bacterium]|nr:adenylosuccinate synthase [Chloroflexota bacterium]